MAKREERGYDLELHVSETDVKHLKRALRFYIQERYYEKDVLFVADDLLNLIQSQVDLQDQTAMEKETEGEDDVDDEEYDVDPDAHTCEYSAMGECQICGAIKYGSPLYRELYGGE